MNCIAIIVLSQVLIGFSPPLRLASEPPATIPQNLPRIALVGVTSSIATDSRSVESALAQALSRDSRVVLVDQSIVQPARAGIRYDGSINMSKDEARKLGAAIGCDFFIVGKAEIITRSELENESHEEAYVGVMVVDGRTGALAIFDFVSNKASLRDAAQQALLKSLDAHARGYVDQMVQIREQGTRSQPKMSAPDGGLVEDVPEEGSSRASGFTPPQFINRVKPEYPTAAEKADISATVEAMVVLRSNGEVGGIEITRWAGFGLDSSSEQAIRNLKFRPATRDGNPINVRAMIRYNFRRVSEANSKPEQPAAKPPERVERDLREIFKPAYRRP